MSWMGTMGELADIDAATGAFIAPPLSQAARIQKNDTRLVDRRKMAYPVSEIRVAIYNTKRYVLARYLNKRCQEIQSATQLVTIQILRG